MLGGGGGGGKFVSPSIQMSVKFSTSRSYNSTTLQDITYKLGNFTKFEVLFPAVSLDFRYIAKIN